MIYMHAQWEGTSARAPAFPFNKVLSAAPDIICEYFSSAGAGRLQADNKRQKGEKMK